MSDSSLNLLFGFAENFARRLQYLTHKATMHPDLRDGYLAKSQIAAQKYDIITDEEKVKGQLIQLDLLFQNMEKRLADVQSGQHSALACCAWLCVCVSVCVCVCVCVHMSSVCVCVCAHE